MVLNQLICTVKCSLFVADAIMFAHLHVHIRKQVKCIKLNFFGVFH